MRDTVHTPTLKRWLNDLTAIADPTHIQITEAWQIAQTLHAIKYPLDQQALDDARRKIMAYLARSENEWSKPPADHLMRRHAIVPSAKKIRSWTEIELTPDLSWSILLAGHTIPARLVKTLRVAHGRQLVNIQQILRHAD